MRTHFELLAAERIHKWSSEKILTVKATRTPTWTWLHRLAGLPKPEPVVTTERYRGFSTVWHSYPDGGEVSHEASRVLCKLERVWEWRQELNAQQSGKPPKS